MATTLTEVERTASGAWKTDRLSFRSLRKSDLDWYLGLWSDPLLSAMCSPSPLVPNAPLDSRQFEAMLNQDERLYLVSIICLEPGNEARDEKEQDSRIGMVTLTNLQGTIQHRVADLALYLKSTFWGCGYGEDALKWTLDRAFKSLNLHRVQLETDSFNTRAQNLWERVGFAQEAKRRQAIWHEGFYYDSIGYGMLENEWRERDVKPVHPEAEHQP